MRLGWSGSPPAMPGSRGAPTYPYEVMQASHDRRHAHCRWRDAGSVDATTRAFERTSLTEHRLCLSVGFDGHIRDVRAMGISCSAALVSKAPCRPSGDTEQNTAYAIVSRCSCSAHSKVWMWFADCP